MPSRPVALVMRHAARRIAELRVGHGWSQDELAEQTGVSAGYVRQVEGGGENLTIATLVKFAEALGVDAGDLFAVPASTETKRGRPPKRSA